MTNGELNQAVCKARGESPTVTWRMMNEAETGYSIEFDTLREINMWQSGHPGMCRGEHIVKWEKWSKYSESIEKAWELVEEIPAEDLFVSVDRRDDGHWICFIGSNHDETIYWSFCEETAPRAICLAYLAWKGAN